METKKDIFEVIPDREIERLESIVAFGIPYEQWHVEGDLFGDRVESLLENGFSVSFISGRILVSRAMPISPEQKMENKRFWRELGKTLDEVEKK